ncbi:hypothetical protein [Acidipropionibacterium timonense]|uniref:hypothetical protein n=1 Tax=Acidipropionibacterium timonense TaxID=2161818 RepID=UPI001031C04F|nr:hypothetical protein [Acidipropionibacterium timonense]
MRPRPLVVIAVAVAAIGAVTVAALLRSSPHDDVTGPTPSPTSVVPSTTTPSAVEPTGPRSVPAPVHDLRLASNDASTFTIAWTPAPDAGQVMFDVLLDGRRVGTVRLESMTLAWPASANRVLIQVAAISPAGVHSPWTALFIIPPPLQLPTVEASEVAGPPLPGRTTRVARRPLDSFENPATSAAPTPSTTTIAVPTSSSSATASAPATPTPTPSPPTTSPSEPATTPTGTASPSTSAVPPTPTVTATVPTPTPSPSLTPSADPTPRVTATP